MRMGRVFWQRVATWAAIAVAVYFGNLTLQTHLGHKALDSTGLRVYPLDEGLARAVTERKLVLATVAAIWCPSCRTLDRQVFGDPEVRELIESEYVFVRLEYESEQGKSFRERYDVKGFPRVLVLDAQARLVRRLPTTHDPRIFVSQLRTEEPRP